MAYVFLIPIQKDKTTNIIQMTHIKHSCQYCLGKQYSRKACMRRHHREAQQVSKKVLLLVIGIFLAVVLLAAAITGIIIIKNRPFREKKLAANIEKELHPIINNVYQYMRVDTMAISRIAPK